MYSGWTAAMRLASSKPAAKQRKRLPGIAPGDGYATERAPGSQ